MQSYCFKSSLWYEFKDLEIARGQEITAKFGILFTEWKLGGLQRKAFVFLSSSQCWDRDLAGLQYF